MHNGRSDDSARRAEQPLRREEAVRLQNEHWQLGVLPGTGASLAYGRIRHEGSWVDVLRPTAEADYGQVEACASFPLMPWSNRIRDARLRFDGVEHRLRSTADDGTAIHGVVRDHPWQQASVTDTVIELSLDSELLDEVNFPWRFGAVIRYALEGAAVVVTSSLRNLDTTAFPAGIGHHPYFRRRLAGAGDEALLSIPAWKSYDLHNALPEAPAGPLDPRVDFRVLRPIGREFIDDLLTDRAPASEPIRMRYPETGRELQLFADDGYRHIVIYAPQQGEDFFAVEPVSNANDGFTLAARGVPGHGVFVLQPGQERTLEFRMVIGR